MPRGRKKQVVLTLEEKIMEVDVAIEDQKAELSRLKELRRQLLTEQEKAEMTALYEAVKASGKTPAELLELVNRG